MKMISLKFPCKADLDKFQRYFNQLDCKAETDTLTMQCAYDKVVIEIATKIFNAEVLN
ncbi:MAG TPA: hypothetical protein VFU62_01195 [Hanamia sp.]|jgi:hypothetical protein|nr:hypothetical protein [Hanamia sp.]